MTKYKTLPLAKISQDYESGDSMKTIARRYQVGTSTVRRILAASSVPIRGLGRYNGDTETRLIPTTYTSTFWSEPVTETLTSQEVAKLRRAVGWGEAWAGPYDAINGD